MANDASYEIDPANDEAGADAAPLLLPLGSWHRKAGARMVPFAGYEMPIQYTGEGGGIVAEHEWTRSSASLFDVSHMGQLVVSGEDASAGAALEALLPGAISALKEGRMRYSYLLDEEGGILDDLMVTRFDADRFGIVVNGAVKWDDIAHLREHLPDEITLTHLDDRALLALQGPQAGAVMADLVPEAAAMVFMQSGKFDWQGTSLGICRAGYTGEDGFEISVRADRAEALADALVGDDRVRPAGLGARDSLRLEAGLPLYGHDITTATDPVSAQLGFALSRKRRESGGYMGHAAVRRALDEGTRQRRVGLLLDGRMPAREGARVFSGESLVGEVTSGGFSPSLKRPIAMAYIDTAYASEGSALEIEVRSKRLAAIVSPMPFVPHRYYRGS